MKACCECVRELDTLFDDFKAAWTTEIRRRSKDSNASYYLYEKSRRFKKETISEKEQVDREEALGVIYAYNQPFIVELITKFQV